MSWRDAIAKAVLGGKIGGPTERGIMAYHSSPFDFDKFAANKLRTGEGGNMYGAGTYLAENPAVSGRGGEYWDNFAGRFPREEELASRYLQETNFDRNAAAAMARKEIEQLGNFALQNRAAQAVKLLESDKPIIGPRTYEVNINARPDLFLNWDKPISQQPEMLNRLPQGTLDLARREAYTRALGATDKARQDLLYDVAKNPVNAPGEFIMRSSGNSPQFSQQLNDAGIAGVRYLDQGSRTVPADIAEAQRVADHWRDLNAKFPSPENAWWLQGAEQKLAAAQQAPQTSNYVVFDPSRLSIMAKYGVVGGVPLGAIAAQDQYGAQQ